MSSRALLLSCAFFSFSTAASCNDPPPAKNPPAAESSDVPAVPDVNAYFVTRALGAGWALLGTPYLADLDQHPGMEAVFAAHKNRTEYQIAVVRGNAKVLGRTPLSAKLLTKASVRAVAQLKVVDLFRDGSRVFLLPVETAILSQHQPLCGVLAFRYLREALSVVGEFSIRCWRDEAGKDTVDPYSLVTTNPDPVTPTVETVDDAGQRSYRYAADQHAFNESMALPKRAAPGSSRPAP